MVINKKNDKMYAEANRKIFIDEVGNWLSK